MRREPAGFVGESATGGLAVRLFQSGRFGERFLKVWRRKELKERGGCPALVYSCGVGTR